MAEAKFTTMTCKKCEGSLFYDEAKKNWRCRYCGTYVTVPIKDPEIEGIARQILIEVANGNLEKAREWLSECEKKDHTKVATMISRISIAMAEMQSAPNEAERNKCMSDLKAYMQQYWQKYRVLGPEETHLYESFGEDSADAFAELVYLFSFMRLEDHIRFCLNKLNAFDVRSVGTNGRLLRVALARRDNDLVSQILSNTTHIDHKSALTTVLEGVKAEGEESAALKAGYIKKVADKAAIEHMDARYFATYFEKSSDPVEVKTELLRAIQETGLQLETKRVFDALKGELEDQEQLVEVLDALYKKAVIDSDTQGILTDALTTEGATEEQLFTILSFMDERKIYTSLNSKVILDFLARNDVSAAGKCRLLQFLNSYPIDNAVRNAVLKGYLCENAADSPEDRRVILTELLKFAPSVSTQAMHQYVENCTIDQRGKAAVIQMILDGGFKPSFARDLLGNYMMNCPDDAETQDEVFKVLSDAGFQIDPAIMQEYLSRRQSDDNTDTPNNRAMDQNDVVKRAMESGADVQADALDNYLAGILRTEDFDGELVNTLKAYYYYITPSTFCNYMLNIHDPAKVQNCRDFAGAVEGDIKGMRINLNYNADGLEVNLLQAYLLICNEPYETMNAVTQILKSLGLNLKQDIRRNAARVKFKKFVKDESSQITPTCMRICNENKLFSLF